MSSTAPLDLLAERLAHGRAVQVPGHQPHLLLGRRPRLLPACQGAPAVCVRACARVCVCVCVGRGGGGGDARAASVLLACSLSVRATSDVWLRLWVPQIQRALFPPWIAGLTVFLVGVTLVGVGIKVCFAFAYKPL